MIRDIKKCRSCGAEIFWVKTTNGKSMPLDVARKTFFFVDDEGVAHAKHGYTSHFATCPDADKHRKPKRQGTLF